MTPDARRGPKVDGAGHPEPEQLAAFADRTLAAGERLAIERHLVECPRCRDTLADTMTFLTANPETASTLPAPQRASSRLWRRPLVAVASTLAAAALIVLAVRVAAPVQRWWSGTEKVGVAVLVQAFETEPVRPADGRLTGGFPYAPPPMIVRAAGDSSDRSPAVRLAIAAIERTARTNSSADSGAALGVAYLVNGDLDQAIAMLERAVSARPDDARFWSDLSVAYLTRGSRGSAREDLERALNAADRARTLAPGFPEATFNRAIALETLGREADAVAAWRDAAEAEPGSPWAAEALERMRARSSR